MGGAERIGHPQVGCPVDVMIGGSRRESKGFPAAAERCPLRQTGFLQPWEEIGRQNPVESGFPLDKYKAVC